MTVFLKGHGTGTTPLPDRWIAAGSRLVDPGRTGFARCPRIVPGDRLLLEKRHLELAVEALAGAGR